MSTNGATHLPSKYTGLQVPPGAPPLGTFGAPDVSVPEAVAILLRALGIPEDEHTADTPRRVAEALGWLTRGQDMDPRRHLRTTFPGERGGGLVCVSGLRVVSLCAHHLLPVTGHATVAYRPAQGAPIVGLSKLGRVLEEYAARATVQETLGAQVAAAVAGELRTEGAACIITAAHGCMTLRGVQQTESVTTTISVAGGWSNDALDLNHALAEHRRKA